MVGGEAIKTALTMNPNEMAPEDAADYLLYIYAPSSGMAYDHACDCRRYWGHTLRVPDSLYPRSQRLRLYRHWKRIARHLRRHRQR